MKWIKHQTATRRDEKIARLIAKHGMAAYGLYWAVQEIIAEQMEGQNPSCKVSYPVSVWSHQLSSHPPAVEKQLRWIADAGLLEVSRVGCDIVVTNVKLLKYRDEYSRKSGHTPDTLPTNSAPEKEAEKEAELEAEEEKEKNRGDGESRQKKIIESVFSFYCEKLNRSPKKYQLSDERRKRAGLRFQERLKANDGNEAAVEQEFAQAVENLAASEFHVTNSHTDWLDQIFRSQEEFEKRLNWKKQGGHSNGAARKNGNNGQSADDVLRELGAETGANSAGGEDAARADGQARKPNADETLEQTVDAVQW